MQLKNYDVKIFPAQLGWLKHFPASAQLKFGLASAQTLFGWTFAASALAPRSSCKEILKMSYKSADYSVITLQHTTRPLAVVIHL